MNNCILDPYLHKINQKNSRRIFQICIAPSCCVSVPELDTRYEPQQRLGPVCPVWSARRCDGHQSIHSLFSLSTDPRSPGSRLHTEYREQQNDINGGCGDQGVREKAQVFETLNFFGKGLTQIETDVQLL